MPSRRVCPPDCRCGKHAPRKHDISTHPPGCNCIAHNLTRNTEPCEPGCHCGKHFQRKCPRGCTCGRHNRRQRMLQEYTCLCRHHKRHHDAFGCQMCAKHRHVDEMCMAFRSEIAPVEKQDQYGKKVIAEGFTKHVDEIATCTACWMPVKIGRPGTISCVIAAKAHKQLCTRSDGRQVNSHAVG